MLTRRSATVAGLALLGACATRQRPPTPRSHPLGLASITVRNELQQDYAGTLRKVAALGYTHFGFPLAAMDPRMPAGPDVRDVAAMVRDSGMEVGVVRYGFARPAQEQMERAAQIGASIVAYTAAPVFFRAQPMGRTTRAAFDRWLPELEALAERAGAAGLRLAYHNHWWDHVPLGGETPLDIIARSFTPAQVGFEIDLAWAWLRGVAPLELIRQLAPRVASMHFKDVDAKRGPDLFRQLVAPGEGDLGYEALIPRLDRVTSAIGYVEVDDPVDGLDAAAKGARAIFAARQAHVG
jgi:sugar phosphate isomerase/epimerase